MSEFTGAEIQAAFEHEARIQATCNGCDEQAPDPPHEQSGWGVIEFSDDKVGLLCPSCRPKVSELDLESDEPIKDAARMFWVVTMLTRKEKNKRRQRAARDAAFREFITQAVAQSVLGMVETGDAEVADVTFDANGEPQMQFKITKKDD